MDSEYPPLPPSKGPSSSIQASHRRKPNTAPSVSSEEHQTSKKDSRHGHGERRQTVDFRQSINIISIRGDVIIEYTDRDGFSSVPSGSGHRWLVASEDLIRNSPYFRALLDPNKFSEGRQFMQQKTDWSQKNVAVGRSETTDRENAALERPPSPFSRIVDDGALIHELPKLSLPVDQFTRRLGVDAIELFLKLLSFQSLDDGDEKKLGFYAELKIHPPSLVARLVEIADAFNSPQVAREALRRCGYVYGKSKVPLSKFNQPLLKMNEDRIRQIIYIAHFLRDSSVLQVSTHTLLVAGSRYWVNGVEVPSTADNTFRWLYFTDGLEEELYYRRQCVLNTIADLQAYFLRAYGGLEESTGPKPTAKSHPISVPATSTTIRPREFQCRCGFGNSNACDAFHLGQMVRFFAIRTKTVFLGSSLLDSEFTLDSDEEDGYGNGDGDGEVEAEATITTTSPPTDITAIIASLKQLPDYQVDSNHTGCGIRRRIIPALDCIERFVGDGRGLLGISSPRPTNGDVETKLPLAVNSWRAPSLRRAWRVDIRFSRITAVHYMPPGGSSRTVSQEEDARLFFTARKRYWES